LPACSLRSGSGGNPCLARFHPPEGEPGHTQQQPAVLPALAYKPCDLLSSWKPTSIAQSRRHRAIRVEG
jgi:hypothetical protein